MLKWCLFYFYFLTFSGFLFSVRVREKEWGQTGRGVTDEGIVCSSLPVSYKEWVKSLRPQPWIIWSGLCVLARNEYDYHSRKAKYNERTCKQKLAVFCLWCQLRRPSQGHVFPRISQMRSGGEMLLFGEVYPQHSGLVYHPPYFTQIIIYMIHFCFIHCRFSWFSNICSKILYILCSPRYFLYSMFNIMHINSVTKDVIVLILSWNWSFFRALYSP